MHKKKHKWSDLNIQMEGGEGLLEPGCLDHRLGQLTPQIRQCSRLLGRRRLGRRRLRRRSRRLTLLPHACVFRVSGFGRRRRRRRRLALLPHACVWVRSGCASERGLGRRRRVSENLRERERHKELGGVRV